MTASMTGFARAEGRAGNYAWVWEVRSLNGRNLDVRCRLPGGLDALEPEIRRRTAQRFKRGHLTLMLEIEALEAGGRLVVNRSMLDELVTLAQAYAGAKGVTPPSLDGLLAIRGVVDIVNLEATDEARAARDETILAGLDQVFDKLDAARREEGTRLAALLRDQLASLGELARSARAADALRPEAARARLKARIDELLAATPALTEERLAQEAALLAAKADIREEIDRLEAHIAAAREILAADEQAGRRLDFLAQELNREANTICSKAQDIELTRIGLDLKAVIDQFREQVQNIE